MIFPHPLDFAKLEEAVAQSPELSEDIETAINNPADELDFEKLLNKHNGQLERISITTVRVSIPEPDYYEEFRTIHEQEFTEMDFSLS